MPAPFLSSRYHNTSSFSRRSEVQVHTLVDPEPTTSARAVSETESIDWNLRKTIFSSSTQKLRPFFEKYLCGQQAQMFRWSFYKGILKKKNTLYFPKSGSRPSLLKYSWIRTLSFFSPRSFALSVSNNDRQTNCCMNGGWVPITYLNPSLHIGIFLFVGRFRFPSLPCL